MVRKLEVEIMSAKQNLVQAFTEKAELVSATVLSVSSIDEALKYVIALCDKKDACQLLMSGCEREIGRAHV